MRLFFLVLAIVVFDTKIDYLPYCHLTNSGIIKTSLECRYHNDIEVYFFASARVRRGRFFEETSPSVIRLNT